MKLFLLLSGAGAWYALRSRSGGQYLVERVKRLLIPVYTVGLFMLIPPQVYFEAVANVTQNITGVGSLTSLGDK